MTDSLKCQWGSGIHSFQQKKKTSFRFCLLGPPQIPFPCSQGTTQGTWDAEAVPFLRLDAPFCWWFKWKPIGKLKQTFWEAQRTKTQPTSICLSANKQHISSSDRFPRKPTGGNKPHILKQMEAKLSCPKDSQQRASPFATFKLSMGPQHGENQKVQRPGLGTCAKTNLEEIPSETKA